MELYEQVVTGICLIAIPIVLGIAVVGTIVRVALGTDLRDLDAMRSTNPRLFRQMVSVLRFNGALCVGLGALISAIGAVVAIVAFSTITMMIGLAFLPLGAGIGWISFRWCRWAWRTELE